jgi:hypothetical protein
VEGPRVGAAAPPNRGKEKCREVGPKSLANGDQFPNGANQIRVVILSPSHADLRNKI